MGDLTVYLTREDRIKGGTSSKGNQQKWYKDGFWYKEDYLGYEGLVEEMVSLLLEDSNVYDYVAYEVCKIYEDGIYRGLGCRCKTFLEESQEFLTFYRMFEDYAIDFDADIEKKSTENGISYVVEVIKELYGVDISYALLQTLALDIIILNEDRHLHNLGVIREDTGIYTLAPIFDNALGLLSDVKDYPLTVATSIHERKVKMKPFTTSFTNCARAIQTLHPEPILKFNMQAFYKRLVRMKTDYDEEYVQRATSLLKTRLERWRGKLWSDI